MDTQLPIIAPCRGTRGHQACRAARRRAHAAGRVLLVVHPSPTSATVRLDLPDGQHLSAAAQAALHADFDLAVVAGWVRPGGFLTLEPGGATWRGLHPARLDACLADIARLAFEARPALPREGGSR